MPETSPDLITQQDIKLAHMSKALQFNWRVDAALQDMQDYQVNLITAKTIGPAVQGHDLAALVDAVVQHSDPGIRAVVYLQGLAGAQAHSMHPTDVLTDIKDIGAAKMVQQMLQDLIADAAKYQSATTGVAC